MKHIHNHSNTEYSSVNYDYDVFHLELFVDVEGLAAVA